jgi:TRAP-type C4-dicarboxylate transport system substrate-binding protein
LVTSDAWKQTVHPAIEQNGFKALWYTSTSARTFSVRKGLDPILSVDDLAGIKFRVPGSKMLQQFYRLLGANPTPVAWGETPAAIKQGVADALDPVIGGLVNFGFQDILDHIKQAQSVHGGQVFSCNLKWFKSLPLELQDAVEAASDITQRQNLAKIPAAFAYAKSVMETAGVQVHSLDEADLERFKEAAGHQRPEWDGFKTELAGSLAKFDELLEASQETNPRYYVDNV